MNFEEFAESINDQYQEEHNGKTHLFDEGELEALMISVIEGYDIDPDSEWEDIIDIVMPVIRWAEGIKVGEAMLGLIFKGVAVPVGIDPVEGLSIQIRDDVEL